MRRQVASVGCLMVGMVSISAGAGNVWIPGGEGGNITVRTVQERKFDHVVRQQYDFSCGSAALATLLTFHYSDPTDEQKAFAAMYADGDQEKIAKVGFSLLDMKKYLDTHGYQADGYAASLEVLEQARVAAIALINYRGYQHFVVVTGLKDNLVLVGDPSLGSRVIPRADFEGMWPSKILFIIKNKSDVGQKSFNKASEWSATGRAPLGMAVSQESLAAISIMLPMRFPDGSGDF